jgi:tRNA dimethylallyltransferase
MLKPKSTIIVISGATASGKSGVAMQIATIYNGAIINADSLQIYRDLPILSAQPTPENFKEVEHFLYGILDSSQKISVGIWLKMVAEIVEKIQQENKIPIIVGGNGMYISKLIDGINEIPEIDEKFRLQAQNLYAEIGHEKFQENFGNAKIIDKQKLLRACEVFLQTGKKIEFFQQQPRKKLLENYQFIHLNLNPARQEIYKNCDERFAKMLQNNVLKEVENYLKNNNDLNSPIINTLGFKEIVDFFDKKISFTEMQKLASQKTRNYAKRQLTWFRHQFDEILFCENQQKILEHIKNIDLFNHEI